MRVALTTLTMMAACAAVALPLSAAARGQGNPHGTPRPGGPKQMVGCEVLGLPSEVTVGETYPITIVRVPRYPGQWWSPTITTITFVDTTEVASAEMSFQGIVTSNRFNTSILIPEGDYISGSDVTVFASVEEPQNSADCSAVSTLILPPAP